MSLEDPSLEPLKWGTSTLGSGSGQIGWAMDLTGLNRADGYSVEAFEAQVEDAFGHWEEVANIDFGMVPAAEADILFQVAPLEMGAGLARVTFSEEGPVDLILSGEITIDGDRIWTPEGQDGGSDFAAVALHEVGHVLGLAHIEDPDAIMNATIFVDDLSERDVDAIQELYGAAEVGDESDPKTFEEGAETPEDDDDGGSGGPIGLLVAFFAAIVAFFFGGGSAGVAVIAAAGDLDDGGDDAMGVPDLPELGDDGLPPAIMVEEHTAFLPEDGKPHGHGCDCACCSDQLDDFI